LSTIMVVDDDPDQRFLLREILETDGHEIVEAANGEAALGVLINPSYLPDVITTDLTMPILNGHGLIERLRAEPRTAGVRIVVVSANPDAARALHASGQIEAFVIKPFDASVLASCVRSVASAPMRPVVVV